MQGCILLTGFKDVTNIRDWTKLREISNTPCIENICKCPSNLDGPLPHAKVVLSSYGLLECL
jgi:hypothetical protein